MRSKKLTANRFLAAFLAVLMIASVVPVGMITSFAAAMETYTVTVTTDGTSPVENAEVIIYTGAEKTAIGEAVKTDAEGKAIFEVDTETVSVDGYKVTKLGYEDAEGEFAEDAKEAAVTLAALATVTVQGVVTTPAGEGEESVALEGVAVKVTGYNEYEAVTNAEGEFAISGVYAGKDYTLTATLAEYKKAEQKLNLEEGASNAVVMTKKAEAEVIFANAEVEAVYGQSVNVNASTTSDATKLTYQSGDLEALTVDANGNITVNKVGDAEEKEVKVTVSVAETDNYLAASAVCTVVINKAGQPVVNWDKAIPANLTWKDTFKNTLTGGLDNDVTYEVKEECKDIASVAADGTLTFTKPGTVTVIATMAGDENHTAATLTYDITVGKAKQDGFKFNETNPSDIYYGDEYTNAASGHIVEGEVTYKSDDESIVKVLAGGKLEVVKGGTVEAPLTVVIRAFAAGNELYEDATAEYKITVLKADQKAEFKFDKTGDQTIKYGDEFTNAANGGENSPITYVSSDTTVADVDANGKITTYKAGKTIITATNPEDDRYNKKEISYTLFVEKADQEIVLEHGTTDIPAITYGEDYTNKVTDVKTEYKYSSSDDLTATVEDGVVTPLKSGTVTITVTAKETEQYNKAEVSYTLVINRAQPTASFKDGYDKEVTFNDNGNKFTNEATTEAAYENGPVYTVEGPANIDAATGEVTITGAGTITVTATWAQDDRYEATSKSYILTVKQYQPEIKVDVEDGEVTRVNGEEFTAPTVEVSELHAPTVVWEYAELSDLNDILSVDGATGALTFSNRVGEAEIKVTLKGDADYLDATATYKIKVVNAVLDENVDYYELTGAKANAENEWFTGKVSVEALEGYAVSKVSDAAWEDTIADIVTEDGNANVATFYVRDTEKGTIYGPVVETVKLDTTYPTASIKIEELGLWDKFWDEASYKLLTLVNNGTWPEDKKTAYYAVEANDNLTDVKIEYLIVEDTELLTVEELEAMKSWKDYVSEADIEIDGGKLFTVYAKATDVAGNVTYVSTNGIVHDPIKPDITIKTDNDQTMFGGDTIVKLNVVDAAPYSGLAKVTYQILVDGNIVEEKVLHNFEDKDPAYAGLVKDLDREIKVDAHMCNSDDVEIKVLAVDNAGNIAEEKSEKLIFSVGTPKIDVDLKLDDYLNDYNGVKYFQGSKTATVTITGRESVFSAKDAVITVNAEKEGTYSVSEWSSAMVGDSIDTYTRTATIEFTGDDTYSFTVDYTDKVGHTAESYASEKFTVDNDKPTGTLKVDKYTWDKVMEVLSFGIWSSTEFIYEKTDDTAKDATSPIKSVEYYVHNGDKALSDSDLKALATEEWKEFTNDSITADERVTVYLKITDYAENVSFISSDGIIVEDDVPVVEFDVKTEPSGVAADGTEIYNSDVVVEITATDNKTSDTAYTGLSHVEYWVKNGDATTENKVLYRVEYVRDENNNSNGGKYEAYELIDGEEKLVLESNGPKFEELASQLVKEIVIDSKVNDGCNIVLVVRAEDNAGNVKEENYEIKFDIDVTKPAVDSVIDETDAYKETDGRFYFANNKQVEVTYVEREHHFDKAEALGSIKITAVDSKGEAVVVYDKDGNVLVDENGAIVVENAENLVLNGEEEVPFVQWSEVTGETANEETRVATFTFVTDANYTFEVTYTDKAANICDPVAPIYFTVDKVLPTGTVTVDGKGTWSILIENLTFGLWSSTSLTAKATYDDATAGIESVHYFVTNTEEALSLEDLKAYDAWLKIENLSSEVWGIEDRFTVYVRMIDNSGNTDYISSDGVIIDATASDIFLKVNDETIPSAKDGNLYNTNVKIDIGVAEDEQVVSGIQFIEYWVECDGIETKRVTLYESIYTRDEGENSNGGKLVVNEWFSDDNVVTTETEGAIPTYAELCKYVEKTVEIDANANNSDDVKVFVRTLDNAGNERIESIAFKIDVTAPTIKVTYGDTPNRTIDGRGYFGADRTATIVITERTSNFEELVATEGIVITAVDVDSNEIVIVPADMISDWATVEGATPDDATHTATIEYTTDANYTFDISYTDKAGNENDPVETVDGETPYTFTIDETAPELKLTYDNNQPYKVDENGRGYFGSGASRTATLTITEDICAVDVDELVYDILAKNFAGEDVAVVEVVWADKTPGMATHTATITYTADANYTFSVDYTNYAGYKNEGVDTVDSVAPYTFTIDNTLPTGTVKVDKFDNVWSELITKLTFGLWTSETVTVTGTSEDVTAGVESVSYYKTAGTTALTEADLRALDASAWSAFTSFEVKANEQFTAYIRIIDNSGNHKYISTNGVIVDNIKPDFLPALEDDKPEIEVAPVEDDINGIYKDDVTVAVKVIDPIVGGTYSGLDLITYEVTNMGVVTQSGTLYDFTVEAPTQAELLQLWQNKAAIVVDSELNNSNDVKVKLTAVDNSGNVAEAELALKIDITKPTIDITYDNNDGDTTFAESTYFKADRTAKIVITERNFDADDVIIKITNTDEVIPTLSAWTTVKGEGNGDTTTHTATITYSADGDYTFSIEYTDEAGNESEPVNYGDSLAPTEFTVDKTAPKVIVSYDNNDFRNGNYYKAQRVATITVTEHNFETSRVKITLTATDNGRAIDLPKVGAWNSNGDVHTVKITFASDALYTFDFDYEDKAGNAIAPFAQQTFYVDKTNPVLSIENIVDESANNTAENIGYVIEATDTNFDNQKFIPVLTAVIRNADGEFEEVVLENGNFTDITNGRRYTVTNLESDGIYRITCTLVDKAGNAYSEVILHNADGADYTENRSGSDNLLTFSVNRLGSSYEVPEYITSLVSKFYIQRVNEDLVFEEINPDVLTEYKITINGKELTEDTDYKVELEEGEGGWKKYKYTVNKSLFEAEGEYSVVLSSKDKATNDAFSDVKDVVVNFIVDRTAPVVTVSGLETNGRYQVDSQKVTVMPTDDGGHLYSLIVRIFDRDGKMTSEPINLEGDALIEALEAGAGMLTFEIAQDSRGQSVQIICTDKSGDEDENTNTYDETFENVTVSANGFVIFWANPTNRYLTISGVVLVIAAVVAFIFFKKKKNAAKKDEE